MKSKLFLLVVTIAATATIISCAKSKNEELSQEQQVLLGKMNIAYNSAKLYNDSLMNYSATINPQILLINQYDSCFHANDSMFNHCHTSMMNAGGEMMGSNGGMMSENDGMMGNSGNNSMCNIQNDELNQVVIQMSQLKEIHKNYHPNN